MTTTGKFLQDVRACRICAGIPDGLPHTPRPVLQLHPAARLCIAGQAPGRLVHETVIPFNDPGGERLREWMQVDRETFYDPARIAIVPMGLCYPGRNDKGSDLPPRKECAPLWRERIFSRLPDVELVLLIGQYAQAWHLGAARPATLTETVFRWRDYIPRYLPMPHPSWRNNHWIKKNPWFEEEVLPWLRQEVSRLVRPGSSGG